MKAVAKFYGASLVGVAELDERWRNLTSRYATVKRNLSEQECKEFEGLISKTKDHILKGKVEAAELKLLNLDFKIKDLENPR